MAAQNQSLYTTKYHARIMKNVVDPKCRMCDQCDETIAHLVSGYPVIRVTEYKKDMIQLIIICIWRFANITKPYTIKAGMNINHNLLLKQRVPEFLGSRQYIQTEKLTPINLTLQSKIIKTTPVYWLSWCFLWIKTGHLENWEKHQNTSTWKSK